jgi:hypothetical protein
MITKDFKFFDIHTKSACVKASVEPTRLMPHLAAALEIVSTVDGGQKINL